MSLLATVYLVDILIQTPYFFFFLFQTSSNILVKLDQLQNHKETNKQTNKQIFDWKVPANDRVSFHDERLAVIFGTVEHTMCLLIMIITQKSCLSM